MQRAPVYRIYNLKNRNKIIVVVLSAIMVLVVDVVYTRAAVFTKDMGERSVQKRPANSHPADTTQLPTDQREASGA